MTTFPKDLHAKPPFLMDEGLLSISPACYGQLVKMLITVEPWGVLTTFIYLFFIYLFCNMLTVSISRFGELNTDQYSVVALFNFACPTL